jgi:sulfide:quinone oxidoreductase
MPHTVLIAGSGPAAIEAALALRAFGGGRLRVQMLTPATEYVHRPVSVLEPFAAGHARRYDLDRLRELGIQVLNGTLARVDTTARLAITDEGREIRYDDLLLATGAEPRAAVPGAVTFAGRSQDVEAVHGMLQDLEGGWTRRIAFVAPAGCGWTLPLYELALQTAERAADSAVEVRLMLFTGEREPLEALGPSASAAVRERLESAGVRLVTGATGPSGRHDRVVALPVLVPRKIAGLPAGFLAVDRHGRVSGVEHVYAAGDGTDSPIKQGGLATQQAEAAAEAIALAAGLRPAATPYAGVLRAMLLTGARPLYLRRRLDEPDGTVSERCLWWPPGKIAGSRLAPFVDALDETESAERRVDRRVARRVAVVGR